MTAAGDAGQSFAEVEGRICQIEEGLLGLRLPAGMASVRVPKPSRLPRILRWGLPTLLAICGSAAVIGPFLLIVAS